VRAAGEADKSLDRRAVASLLLERGRLEEAIAELHTALETSRSAGDAAGEGHAEILLARAYRQTGGVGTEHVRLVRLHAERAEAAYRRAGDRPGLIDALSLLTIHFNERDDAANVRYTLAKLHEVHPATASWLGVYSDALARMFADPEGATVLFQRALASLDHLVQNGDLWRGECLRKLAFLKDGEHLGRSGESGGKTSTWYGLFEEAVRLTLEGGADETVERTLDQAIEAAENLRCLLRSEVKQRELSQAMDPMYVARMTLADRAGRLGEALDAMELNTSRSLLSRAALRGMWARSPTRSFERLRETNNQIQDCLVRYQRTDGTGGESEQLQLALLRRREASHWVQEELVRLVPQPHEVFNPTRSSSLQASLGEDDALVVFLSTGLVYLVRPTGVSKVTTFDMEAVSNACKRYGALASSPRRPFTDPELDRVGEAIAEVCIEPVVPLLKDAARVFIVPCGRLWAVPLGLVGRKPLADTHSVGIVPNLSIAHRLIKQRRPTRRVERFVGVGNPDETLPGAAEEVETVAVQFDDRAVLTGADVDFLRVLQLVRDADVIHLACHGVSFSNYPELSYLHIAGSPDAPQPWFVEDVLRVPMSPRLVVLSACDAGTAVALPGKEYVGFPGVFLVADTKTVIAPLWAVPDTSTAVLMKAFYAESRHRSPSSALRAAQEVVRANPATAHPLHWAGFEVFGLP
jgi:CHAT domain-containing protein